MRAIISRLPESVKGPLRRLRDALRALAYSGKERLCPVCGNSSRCFLSFGEEPREDAECPRCGALERHRLVWLFLVEKTDFFDGAPKKMLHVAPEECFEPRWRKLLGDGYLTADLLEPHAMVKMDIANIEFDDQTFDIIYCSHVLEHVPDDRRAMREIHRVLKGSGWAILLVPITVEETFEDPSIVDPQERLAAFGQDDHVRRYGRDYVDRLLEAGFHVEVAEVDDLVGKDEAERMGLTPASGEIYFCTKQG